MNKKQFLFFLLLSFILFILQSCRMNSNEKSNSKKETVIPVFSEQPLTVCIKKGETASFSCKADAENEVVYYKWFKTNEDGSEKTPICNTWTESSTFQTDAFNEKGIYYYVCAASTVTNEDDLSNAVFSNIVAAFYSDLPIVVINTVNNEEPTADYVAPENFGGSYGAGLRNHTKPGARLQIVKPNDNTVIYDSGEYIKKESGLTIKLRGNTSAYADKKPYKIKLQKKADLLADLVGRSDSKYKDKEWVLLKDGVTLNTFVGLAVSDIAGMTWTPDFAYVNLVMNGEYRGIYMLVEAISQSKMRIDVSDEGFIIERDAYWWNEDVRFITDSNQKFTFKYPDEEDILQEQITFITDYMNSVETHIKAGTYENYIDTDSFAKWQLIHDILGSWDAFGSNIYMSKNDSTSEEFPDENGSWSKIYMETPWDFDSNYMMKNSWSNIHHQDRCYSHLLFTNTNTSFIDSYKAQWNNISNSIWQDLQSSLNNLQTIFGDDINISRSGDALKWETKNASIENDIEKAEEWFTSRKIWLDDAIGGL